MKKLIFASLLLGTILPVTSASLAADPGGPGDNGSGPVVQTAEGPVRGIVKNGVNEFLGIPYAAPPVGDLRWMPPQPVAHWTDPLDASQFGNICAQVTTLGVFASPASIDEDCLFLNVFTTKTGSGGG